MARYIERRAETRTTHKSPVKIKDLKTSVFHNARMVNFSNNGLYFEANHVLHAGTEIYLGIENSPFTTLPDVYDTYRAKILWRIRLDSIFYQYGCGVQLISAPDSRYSQVNGFEESRKYPRKTYTHSISFSFRRRHHHGVIKNISAEGVFIETSEPLSVGQKMKLAIPGHKLIPSTILTGQVVRVSPSGVAIRFEKTMPADDGKNSTEQR
jgi:Tfp pilus assembly protein PilZ